MRTDEAHLIAMGTHRFPIYIPDGTPAPLLDECVKRGWLKCVQEHEARDGRIVGRSYKSTDEGLAALERRKARVRRERQDAIARGFKARAIVS